MQLEQGIEVLNETVRENKTAAIHDGEKIAKMEHEVTMLKLRNERVNDQYEATRMNLLKEQAQ